MAKDNFYIQHCETGLYFIGFGPGPDYVPRWGSANEAKPYADALDAQAQAELLSQAKAFRPEAEGKGGMTNSFEQSEPSIDEDYWYIHRHTLREGDIFESYDGSFVKLDRRVPGDGTKWYVADWSGTHWHYEDSTIDPGDLRGTPIDEKRFLEAQA